MKILSIAIPCYNSEAYMEKCIESLLVGGEDVEILVVNDGSSDRTAEIADAYAEKYPTIVKAIHQENGGHGEAVNAGIRNATGLYFKVVDSDDWVNEEAYHQILKTLEELIRGPKTVDLLISNFVYEKQGADRKKVMQYRHCLPVNEIFEWNSVHMSRGKYLLMHSMIYRTKLLHECGLELPKHTFYVDNLFAFEPLPYVNICSAIWISLQPFLPSCWCVPEPRKHWTRKKNLWNISGNRIAGCITNFVTAFWDVLQTFREKAEEKCSWLPIRYVRNSMDLTETSNI